MRIFIATIIVFGIGVFAGIKFRGTPSDEHCPEDFTAALQGCEVTAGTVSGELDELRWKHSNLQMKYIEAAERNKKLLNTFLPDRMK